MEIDLSKPPRKVTTKFGLRFIYDITVDNKKTTLAITSMLDTQIINALMKNINPITVIRVGKGTDTRYSIKGLN